MEEAIVLYPSPPIGHLVPMVELGKLILTHKPSFSIHIIVPPAPFRAESTCPYVSSVSAAVPSITFHQLPAVPPDSSTPSSRNHHESLTFEILRLSNPHLHRTLYSISNKFTISAMIIDFFCTAALEVSANFEFPIYHFFTSGANCLASFLYLPILHETISKSLGDIETFIEIPGVPPFRGLDMAKPLLERNNEVYECFVEASRRLLDSKGIIVNTFEMLEARAIKTTSDGLCIPNRSIPPIYPIGPLIASGDERRGNGMDEHFCLRWLHSQPNESVVFLCFGSLGLFSKEQLHEIAVGLEMSGQRFLWVVRNPPSSADQSVAISDQPDSDLESLLPQGFLERTKERGLVVKSWAPQVAVLRHKSVGGFVTHCGWNSVLESVCQGVPMVAWPLYAEQRFNRVVMVEEIKIALPMTESENGFVSSAEVENRVKELMESHEGASARERAKALKNAAEAALSERGSSHATLTKLLQSWKHKVSPMC